MFCIVGFVVGNISERKNNAENKLKEYSEKLEEKVEERTKEIKHLNLVLRAIRKVNQLLIKEKDRDALIQGACDNLIKTRGFYNAWIVLLDETHKLGTTAEAGMGEKFLPIIEQLNRGELPYCVRKALKQSDVVVIKDPLSICTDCAMVENCSPDTGAMTVRLEYDGKIYGVLYATMPSNFIIDKEEQTLFKEIARDIAFGLYNIEIEERRKRAEEALRESEERYRDLIETSHEIIQSVKADGHFDFVNKAWHDILGYTKKELSKLSLFDIIHPESLEHCKKMFKKVLAGESVTNVEAKFMAKDGSTVFVEGNVTGRYIDGKLVATHGFFRDITEHKHLEQQKEKARKEAEFYADVLAHDVGNLNQITMGYLYLLQTAEDKETRKKNVEGIKKSIMKSKRLAESMKTLKIIKDTKIEKFDLNKSIERSIKNIKEYSDKEIEVKSDIDKHYYVKANDFLDRVFFNILENSVEFIFKEKVIIDIKTEEKDDLCNIHIHDNGIGISKEKKKEILENLETLSKKRGWDFILQRKSSIDSMENSR